MLSAILIDDEPQARQAIRSLLSDDVPDFQVIGEADSVRSGLELLRRHAPDVVFLDIQMSDGTGFDLLDQLPEPDFYLVFTTAFDQFALKAFRYHAINYLIKPVDPDDLLTTCRHIREESMMQLSPGRISGLLDSFRTRKIDKITLSTNEGLVFLPLEDIVRLEASGSYTTFYTRPGERVMVARTLGDFADLLPEDTFFRTHQSHLVNLHFVKKVLKQDGGYALMEHDAKVPISRRNKEAFLRMLMRRSL